MKHDEAIAIQALGASITVTGATASVAIPNNAAGVRAKYVRVASTAPVAVAIGQAAVTASATADCLVQPGDAIVINSQAATHLAAIQVGAVAGIAFVTPLEY